MKQYLGLARNIVDNGKWVTNKRTGVRCKTIISERFRYQVGEDNVMAMVTTRKTLWRSALAELLGYIRGYTSAEDFRKLGTKTWDANANENTAWLENGHRPPGPDHMGIVYGAVGNEWPIITQPHWNGSLEHHGGSGSIDLLDNIYQDLLKGNDDRGEIWTFWNPGMFSLGCLRPCMHSHQFSLLDDKLYLDSTQRSVDVPLGLTFNMFQVTSLLAIMAHITNLTSSYATHNLVNCHIYENQLDIMESQQLVRNPLEHVKPQLIINPKIKTLEDLRTWVTVDDFDVIGYESLDPIKYPFSV